ncbi:7702_t:CDS:2, partial [Acaulospora colombiana]
MSKELIDKNKAQESQNEIPTPESRIEWVRNLINGGKLISIDSSEFETKKAICAGGYGLIVLCRWKNENRDVVLKHMAEIEGDEQLKVFQQVKDGVKIKGVDNIIRFYGVSYFDDGKDTKHDKSSDIYSFGVVMWEISNNGKDPFENQHQQIENDLKDIDINDKWIDEPPSPASCSSSVLNILT